MRTLFTDVKSFLLHFLCIAVCMLALGTALQMDIAVAQSKKSSKKRASQQQETKKYTNKSIRNKEQELEQLRAEIRKYEKQLAESKSMERNTLDRINKIDRQTALIQKLIAGLNERIKDNEQEINIAKEGLQQAELRLRNLQQAYSRYIISIYKRGRTHDTELLLSSASMNQMLIRSRYLKAITEGHRVEAEDIRRARRAIETQKQILEERLQQQVQTRQQKQEEEQLMAKREVEQKGLLQKVRADKAALQENLRTKQKAARRIEGVIAELIEKERNRRLEEARKRAAATPSPVKKGTKGTKAAPAIAELPTTPVSQTAFGKLRGRLPWPVAKGKVVGGFGEQVNKELGTVTVSSGIDIRVPDGSTVKAVADGVVSSINFIPGYGNIVFMSHDDEFFTVYAHVQSISVSKGQKVKAGQAIAKSRSGIEGSEIHFELWHSRNKQNPVSWLAKR